MKNQTFKYITKLNLSSFVRHLLLVLILISGLKSFSQNGDFQEIDRQYMRIMFYNVENLFDTFDDSLKRDEAFTPDGEKHWSVKKYNKKLANISKVIMAVGGWEPPDIIGICEIENRLVLEEILKKTALKKLDYKIIHRESPDRRGIDVAMFYREKKFTPITVEAIRVTFPFAANKPTRDILYVKGVNRQNDTLHFFVNHWPSRWGGQAVTDSKRQYVASVVRAKADSLFKADVNPKIIIMGDLNDYPDNNSLIKVLKARITFDKYENEELYNLGYYLQHEKGKGSHKHEAHWGVLDQIIVSGAVLNPEMKIYATKDDAHVFDAPYLLEKDENQTGYRAFRTYIGFKFHDGFSDHLPVFLDLRKK